MNTERIRRIRKHESEGFRFLELVEWVELLERDELTVRSDWDDPDTDPNTYVFVPRLFDE